LFVCLPGYGIGWVLLLLLLLLHGIQIVEHFVERMRIGKHGADYFEQTKSHLISKTIEKMFDEEK
jgi:Na+-transporting methylmalonyl-CoA/oxaloacetate decarboxylase gamma subunit